MAGSEKIAINVDNVSKTFKLPHEKQSSVKSLFVSMFRRNRTVEKQRVLQNISFEIKVGEFFGIVGRNGSGKSTLLKLLSGIYSPDSGHIGIHGSLTPFIELGVGFNPELTGRENVFLNGALLGFSRTEMGAMYNDIVAFAELERFMDQKLKNYSSGMQVRLAFSIAIKAKNDILIFDEVLAVGDESFQQKCLRIFEEYRESGQTVVLVTHDMNTVKNLCTRAMLIDKGKIAHIGSVESVAERYSDLNARREDAQEAALKAAKSTEKTDLVIKLPVKKVYLPSEELSLHISWSGEFDSNKHMIGVAIIRSDREYVFGSNTRNMKLKHASVTYTTKLNIGPGRYSVSVAMMDKSGGVIDIRDDAMSFRVIEDGKVDIGGSSRLTYEYKEDKIEQSH